MCLHSIYFITKPTTHNKNSSNKDSAVGVKARRDTAAATGHAHINIVSFLSQCTTIITVFAFLLVVDLGLG